MKTQAGKNEQNFEKIVRLLLSSYPKQTNSICN